jgi:hypothetical protein
LAKKPPHGGKVPKPRKPKTRGAKEGLLFIDDIDDALRRIWQRKKSTKR